MRLLRAGDDVGLHVLGCRVDILGTNCNVWAGWQQFYFISYQTVFIPKYFVGVKTTAIIRLERSGLLRNRE